MHRSENSAAPSPTPSTPLALTLSRRKHPEVSRLRRERWRLGLGLREVAENLTTPIAWNTLRRFEEGRPVAWHERITHDLARFYGVDPFWVAINRYPEED